MSAAVFQADPLLSRVTPRDSSGFADEAVLKPAQPQFQLQQVSAVEAGPQRGSASGSGTSPGSTAGSSPVPGFETRSESAPEAGAGSGHESDAPAGPDQAMPAATHRPFEALLADRYREGFEEGLAQGAQLALAQLPAAHEPLASGAATPPDTQLQALLQSVGHAVLELRGAEAAQARFEPLKRLALHLAVELVRVELSVSPQAIDTLVRRCVQALGEQDEVVVVELHPMDLERLQGLVEPMATTLAGVQWRANEGLSRGSVRARSEQSMVEDLIENRLAGLVRDLRIQAERWQQEQSDLQVQAQQIQDTSEHDDD